jgi:hypothetical protein
MNCEWNPSTGEAALASQNWRVKSTIRIGRWDDVAAAIAFWRDARVSCEEGACTIPCTCFSRTRIRRQALIGSIGTICQVAGEFLANGNRQFQLQHLHWESERPAQQAPPTPRRGKKGQAGGRRWESGRRDEVQEQTSALTSSK